jgi:hypothetical protein
VRALTRFPTDRTLNRHFEQTEEWGSAVQIGRGPATVIGRDAFSQATLPSQDGCVPFARENAARRQPRFLAGLFC